MASLVLGIAGAAALGPAGLAWGGALGMSGAQIGFMAGSMLGSSLTKLPEIQGPRLGDLKVQASTYGVSIPIDYGTTRHTGEVMWSSDLIETEHEEEAGKGGPSQSVTSFTYSVNCAVAVCAATKPTGIAGIRRIWANGNLIYDQSAGNLGPTGQSGNIRIYTGSETQVADALEEAYLGVGNVPGYRGLVRVVFENLQLEKYGNRIPNFSFEVVADGIVSTPDHMKLTSSLPVSYLPHPFIDGVFLTVSADNGGSEPYSLHVTDAIAKTDRSINVADLPSSGGSGAICYVDYARGAELLIPLNEIWVNVNSGLTVAVAFDATTLAFKRIIEPDISIGINSVGRMLFDKTSGKVLFSSANFTGTLGYNALDPISLIWDGAKDDGVVNNVYSGNCIAGDSSIAMSNYNTFVCFFVNCQFAYKHTVTNGSTYVTYDSLRKRYAWWDRSELSKSVFQTVSEGAAWELTEYTPDTIAPVDFGSLNYFAIADKYIFSDMKTLYLLNADTFETEDSWLIFPSIGNAYDCMEIPSMPEYLVSMVTNPSDGLALVPLSDRITPNTVTLSSIVTDICERVGLAAGDIDVTGLTDEVEGYTIAQQMTARAAIDGLQAAFYFDAVESD